VCTDKGPGTGQCGICFVKRSGETLEHIRCPRSHFEGYLHIGGGRAAGQPGGVVEQDLVRMAASLEVSGACVRGVPMT
jgi:hypothetical protein